MNPGWDLVVTIKIPARPWNRRPAMVLNYPCGVTEIVFLPWDAVDGGEG